MRLDQLLTYIKRLKKTNSLLARNQLQLVQSIIKSVDSSTSAILWKGHNAIIWKKILKELELW